MTTGPEATIALNAVYGPVPQGEGPTAGHPRIFVRTYRCNLYCGWCDVPWTWNTDEYPMNNHMEKWRVHDLAAHLETMRAPRTGLVITGGEPMLQGRALTELMYRTEGWWTFTEMETNGTRAPDSDPGGLTHLIDQFNVSPKLRNSGNRDKHRGIDPEWRRVSNKIGKFVVTGPEELNEVAELADELQLAPNRIWVMPEARDVLTLTDRHRRIEHAVMERGWNLTTRMQVVGWGNEPGH